MWHVFATSLNYYDVFPDGYSQSGRRPSYDKGGYDEWLCAKIKGFTGNFCKGFHALDTPYDLEFIF